MGRNSGSRDVSFIPGQLVGATPGRRVIPATLADLRAIRTDAITAAPSMDGLASWNAAGLTNFPASLPSIIDTGVAGFHMLYVARGGTGVYTQVARVKPAGRTHFFLGDTSTFQFFDAVGAGVVESVVGTAPIAAAIVVDGDYWIASVTLTGSSANWYIGLANADGGYNYTGDGVSGIISSAIGKRSGI
jgi:hypothetical protein